MKIVSGDLLNSILNSLEQIDYVKTEDIPNINLYMDQVTTFMDEKMKSAARHPEEDKILTKTMINNYAKNNLLPPPVKKKYTKEHMLLLIFIYYFKGILSIGDISRLLEPLTGRFFYEKEGLGLEDIYNEVFSLEKAEVERMKKDVAEKFQKAEETFADAPEENLEFLHQFAFICMLSFDVYVKKQIIEKMIDNMENSRNESPSSGKKEPKEKKKEK
ncbi:MAG: DUF1836 domain-containing protein [Lachnospiraceae bacterium]|nr:DUF1836 domain-containing protein [Lachnospiraceae bacterium]